MNQPHPVASPSKPQPVRSIEDLPTKKGLPVVGVALSLDTSRYHLQLEQWYRESNGPFRFRVGPTILTVFGETNVIRSVLQARPKSLRRSPKMKAILEELGAVGLFSAEGETWRRQRKLISPAFLASRVEAFFPVMQGTVARFRQHLLATAANRPLDIRTEFERLTTDVTTLLAFGHDGNSIERGNDVLQRDIALVFPMIAKRLTAPLPFWRWLPSKHDKAVTQAISRIHGAMAPIIAHAREVLAQDPARVESPETLLEAMIAAEMTDDANERLSEEELLGNVLTLLLAGEDTTAHTLSWLVDTVARKPEIQRRMQAEIDDVLGSNHQLASYQDLKRMPYVDGVIQETLRMRSAAPLLLVQALEDLELEGWKIPANSMLVLLTRYSALSDQQFSDGGEFRPERWLREQSEVVASCPAHQPKANLAFGSGPRTCPGRGLALAEIHSTVIALLSTFDIELVDPSHETAEVFSFTMVTKDLQVMLRPRNRGATTS